ncbi:glycosyltransferase family 2 protein [candidate division KSB1 bacterium]
MELKEENSRVDISVVIPLYNEQESLGELAKELEITLIAMAKSFELIFIDDGSTDKSFETLLKLKEDIPSIKIIQFQANYGKSAALSAGFSIVKGDYVITMDADLQDEPKEIPRLINKLEEGYDLVSGWKKKRNDPFTKKLASKIFNRITSITTGVKLHDHNCGLKAYRKTVVKNLSVYGELHRYLPPLSNALGFKVTEIEVTHHARKYGRSKYGLWRFFSGFFDLLTVLFLTRFTHRPLHLFGIIGLCFFFLGVVINLYLTIQKYYYGIGLGDRPLLFLGVLLIIVGFQSFSMGFLAEMITKEKKSEDNYIIKRIDN